MRLAEHNYNNDYLTEQSATAYRSKKYYEESETELHPKYCNRKSFYGKARIIKNGNTIQLRSYDTIVCQIDSEGKFERMWDDYSVTTMNHIDEFRQQHGMNKLSKKEWLKMEVVTC